MTDHVLPLFSDFPDELTMAGRLVLGYGELEFELAACLGVVQTIDIAIRTLFRARGEQYRIEVADALMRPYFDMAGFVGQGGPYNDAIADLMHCRKIRNQFAHCHWSVSKRTGGLCFVDLQTTAKTSSGPTTIEELEIDAALLTRHEEYFRYVQRCFWHLAEEMKIHLGKLHSRAFKLPKKLERPPLYNGA